MLTTNYPSTLSSIASTPAIATATVKKGGKKASATKPSTVGLPGKSSKPEKVAAAAAKAAAKAAAQAAKAAATAQVDKITATTGKTRKAKACATPDPVAVDNEAAPIANPTMPAAVADDIDIAIAGTAALQVTDASEAAVTTAQATVKKASAKKAPAKKAPAKKAASKANVDGQGGSEDLNTVQAATETTSEANGQVVDVGQPKSKPKPKPRKAAPPDPASPQEPEVQNMARQVRRGTRGQPKRGEAGAMDIAMADGADS